jgi:hypothetical protein
MHGVTSQKAAVLLFNGVKTPNIFKPVCCGNKFHGISSVNKRDKKTFELQNNI